MGDVPSKPDPPVAPSTNGGDDPWKRKPTGRFGPGNKGGPGNVLAKKSADLRTAMYASVSTDDVLEIMSALVEAAKSGNITAAREVLDRVVGKPVEADIQEKIAELERIISGGAA